MNVGRTKERWTHFFKMCFGFRLVKAMRKLTTRNPGRRNMNKLEM
jgi:hypothetical protein